MKASKIKSEINKLIKEIDSCPELSGHLFGELGKIQIVKALKDAKYNIGYAIKSEINNHL